MRLKIDLEIPQWSKWLTAGIAIGLTLGLGAWRVYAATISVKTNWQPGDTLKAVDINSNFQALQDAINGITHPNCPEDYTQDTTATTFVLCKRGTDEVVRVGTGGSAFWIDRYEASIWQNPDGTGTQYGLASYTEFPTTFPESGEYTAPLYALSVPLPAGSQPSAWMTWFQAQMACRLSGKRLPSDEEWLAAAQGTQDPGSHDATGGFCVTNAAAPRNPGAGTACVSVWGAQDMIGNLWEWTANWYAGLSATSAAPINTWTRSAYNGDATWGIIGYASDGDAAQLGLPVAVTRGGSYPGDGTKAGRFALILAWAPSFRGATNGFRCIVPR